MSSRHDRRDERPDVASAIAAQGMRAFLEDHRAHLVEVIDATLQGRAASTTQAEDQIRAALLARLAADLEEVRRRPARVLEALVTVGIFEEPSPEGEEPREAAPTPVRPTGDEVRAALLARLLGDLDEVRRRPGRALTALESVRERAGEAEARPGPAAIPVPVAAPSPPPVEPPPVEPLPVEPLPVPTTSPVALAPEPPTAPQASQPAPGHDDLQSDHRTRRRALVTAAALLGTAAAVVLAVLIGAVLRDTPSDDVSREAPEPVTATAPAGTPENGVLVESVVHDDGTQTVTEWVSSEQPLTRLALEAPSSAALDVVPRAVDVSVWAGGRQVSGDDTVGSPSSVYLLSEASKMVKVTYTLEDSVQLSPDAEGRALVVASALRVGDTVAGPMRVRVTGGKVLSMACAARAGSQDPCGKPAGQGWQVLLSGSSRDDRVITQLDLA